MKLVSNSSCALFRPSTDKMKRDEHDCHLFESERKEEEEREGEGGKRYLQEYPPV